VRWMEKLLRLLKMEAISAVSELKVEVCYVWDFECCMNDRRICKTSPEHKCYALSQYKSASLSIRFCFFHDTQEHCRRARGSPH
jgi:hypothetical protein